MALSTVRFSSLSWNGSFVYPNMVRIYTIGDGSCLFHAIISSFFTPYNKGILYGVPLDRRKFVAKFRSELADKLTQKLSTGRTWYESLSRGELSKSAKLNPEVSLAAMQSELRSSSAVDNKYNELLSEILNKDIYVLHDDNEDLYFLGISATDVLYKNRDSIVILYSERTHHYELVGIKDPMSGDITTLFGYNDPFIINIHSRLKSIIGV